MFKQNPLIKKLLSLNLPTSDYAVFGSGPMYAHGIKDLGHDIDLVARKEAWDVSCKLGIPKKAPMGANEVVILFDGEIEIHNGWAPNKWDVDSLIDKAEIIENIRFVTLENVIKWKKMMGRDKDIEHIKMIEDYLSNTNS